MTTQQVQIPRPHPRTTTHLIQIPQAQPWTTTNRILAHQQRHHSSVVLFFRQILGFRCSDCECSGVKHGSDQRRYNTPKANEIAVVFVNDDGEPPLERYICIYPKNHGNAHSVNLEPMAYPLFCPYAEPGWQPKWHCESYNRAQTNITRKTVTKLQCVDFSSGR